MFKGSSMGNCNNCKYIGPPPDSILMMPPPPLPSFLLPKSALLAALQKNNNKSALQNPCFATFLCQPSSFPHASGMEFVEIYGDNTEQLDNTWFYAVVCSCVGVFIFGGILAVILFKCKYSIFSMCKFSTRDASINNKQSSRSRSRSRAGLQEHAKNNPFIAGDMLYPCATASNRHALDNQLTTSDGRLLWATLTPHGTRHFLSDYRGTLDSNRSRLSTAQDCIYEVVDYRSDGIESTSMHDFCKRTPIKSFDNNGFVDYDYEDPTPLMDSYHDDLDSGYQEPQEILSSLPRCSPRPTVSSPTRIDNPNMPPLNYYPSYQRTATINRSSNSLHVNINTVSPNRKAATTTIRRISDASSAYGSGPNN